jgi:hypothetical protein
METAHARHDYRPSKERCWEHPRRRASLTRFRYVDEHEVVWWFYCPECTRDELESRQGTRLQWRWIEPDFESENEADWWGYYERNEADA